MTEAYCREQCNKAVCNAHHKHWLLWLQCMGCQQCMDAVSNNATSTRLSL